MRYQQSQHQIDSRRHPLIGACLSSQNSPALPLVTHTCIFARARALSFSLFCPLIAHSQIHTTHTFCLFLSLARACSLFRTVFLFLSHFFSLSLLFLALSLILFLSLPCKLFLGAGISNIDFLKQTFPCALSCRNSKRVSSTRHYIHSIFLVASRLLRILRQDFTTLPQVENSQKAARCSMYSLP